MFAFIRNHPVKVGAATVAVVLGLAWVAFGYFGIHTAFVDDVVDEAGPVFDAPAVAAEPAAAPATDAPVDESAAEPAEAVAPVDGPDAEATEAIADASAETETETEATAEVVTEFTGTFAGESRYTITGTADVLGNGTGQRFLRFENFESSNGPDLNVYLRNPETGEFIDLGDLKGNIGSQNYEIAADVDLTEFSEVEIWCVRFGVGFGGAELMPTA